MPKLQPLTPTEQAILLLDKTIRELRLRRDELAAQLPEDEKNGPVVFVGRNKTWKLKGR